MSGRTILAGQALHGYDRGHRLLASSHSIGADSLKLLDRLSDAAGQRPVPDNDGYLTGYPLPNGTYALARTWYAHDAPRPNSVWTHTLLLPHGALDGTDVSRLVSALHAPGSANDLESYAQPFDVTELLHGHPEPLTDVALVADAVTSLYFVGETPAWVELPDVRRRNTLALALWSQQWPRLRRRFTFCTGAIELRRLDQRPFDLLLRPPGYTGIVHASAGGSASYGIDAWRVLVDDLGHPGLLREFLRRCGSDTSRLESAALFAGVWASAVRTDEPLRVTFDRVVAAAPLPTQLRRLKRSLLRGKQAILLCRDAFEVVEGLTQPRIGQALYAEDVGLEDWLGRLWDDDPRALGTALRQATAAETDGRESPATVTESMVRFARSIVLRRARPADLPWVAVDAPNVAADLLSTHASVEWWAAFAALPTEQFRALATRGCGVRNGDEAALALDALTRDPDGHLKWSQLAECNEQVTVAGALRRHAGTAGLGETWTQLVRSHQHAFPASLGPEATPELLAAAASLINQLEVIGSIPVSSWDRLFRSDRLWVRDSQRTAVLFLAGLRTQEARLPADRIVAHTFARLYEALAKNWPVGGWELLSPNLPGPQGDWDRCGRLTRAVAGAVLNRTGVPRPGIVGAVPSGAALTALRVELDAIAKHEKSQRSLVAEIIKMVFP